MNFLIIFKLIGICRFLFFLEDLLFPGLFTSFNFENISKMIVDVIKDVDDCAEIAE